MTLTLTLLNLNVLLRRTAPTDEEEGPPDDGLLEGLIASFMDEECM